MTEAASDTSNARVFGRPDPAAGTQASEPWQSTNGFGVTATPHVPSAAETTQELPAVTRETPAVAGTALRDSSVVAGTTALLGKIKLALPKGIPERPVEHRPVGATSRPVRRARLRISRLDPWSVMKTAFLFSIGFAIIFFVAVWVLWGVIDASGALDSVQSLIDSLISNPDGSGSLQITRFVDQWRVLGFTAILSVVNVVILTALATLMAFLYNLAAGVLGGLEITLAED